MRIYLNNKDEIKISLLDYHPYYPIFKENPKSKGLNHMLGRNC